jgi:hypothetical protein
MSEKRNSWARGILSKISKSPVTKVGEKIGSPIRKSIKGYFKKKQEEKYKAKIIGRDKLEKAKKSYLEKYGKPYVTRTATADETNKLKEFFN